MAALADSIPPVTICSKELEYWGDLWIKKEAFDRKQSMNFASFIDRSFAESLAKMLGGIPIERSQGQLIPPKSDCVEIGNVRITRWC